MENSLRRIRKAAGYRSAKAFAEAIGMPPTTYTKYEQTADDGEISMPLKSAWAIADALGCTIDALVGREEVPDLGMRGDIQRRYDALSDNGRQLVDDFLNMAEMREERARKLAHLGVGAARYLMEVSLWELPGFKNATRGAFSSSLSVFELISLLHSLKSASDFRIEVLSTEQKTDGRVLSASAVVPF